MRGAGLVGALVMSGVVWLSAHGHGGAGGANAGQAYCRDVARLEVVMGDAGNGDSPSDLASRLDSISSAMMGDATELTGRGDSAAAAAVTSLAADVEQWREGLATGDEVNQTIALDRTLSAVSAVPGC